MSYCISRLMGKIVLMIATASFVLLYLRYFELDRVRQLDWRHERDGNGLLTTGVPIADVAVSAVSGSGTYKTITNAHGFYSMAGVYADTYVVTFSSEGFEVYVETGVTVFADQVATVDAKLRKSPTLLSRIVIRAEASAFQPSQTTIHDHRERRTGPELSGFGVQHK